MRPPVVLFGQEAIDRTATGGFSFARERGESGDSIIEKSAIGFNADCVSAIFNP